MIQTTMRRGRVLLLAAVTLLVVVTGGAVGATAISEGPDETYLEAPAYATESVTVGPVSRTTATAPCPDGSRAIDGGLSSESWGLTHVVASGEEVDGSGWSVELTNLHPTAALTVHVWAACLAVG